MQLSDGPRFSSTKSNSETIQFSVTILNDHILLVRLARELESLRADVRWAVHQARQDPAAFMRSMRLKAIGGVRRQLTATNLLGFTSALFVIASLALLVVSLETRQGRHAKPRLIEDSSADVVERPILLVLTASGPSNIYGGSTGRVGVSHGKGEGSAQTFSRSGGGGSGGMRQLVPPQIGKLPQPSEIPAIIPKEPLTVSQALPAAGIDIDPLLWRDIKFPSYGDPGSQLPIRSNGPGENGGMGTNKGFGVGDGSGNGFGAGNNGNTGDGDRRIGSDGVGGGGGTAGLYMTLRPSEVEQKARLLSKPEPHYTEEARRNQITGTVVLRVVFSSTGEVTQIHAVHTLPFGLTERAIAAAREIKFVPAMKGGRPVSVYMQLEYNFNLY